MLEMTWRPYTWQKGKEGPLIVVSQWGGQTTVGGDHNRVEQGKGRRHVGMVRATWYLVRTTCTRCNPLWCKLTHTLCLLGLAPAKELVRI